MMRIGIAADHGGSELKAQLTLDLNSAGYEVVALLGTQILATFIAVHGLFMTPLGWGWALFVWGYAPAWFLVRDRVKLLAYRVFDPTAAPLLAKRPVG